MAHFAHPFKLLRYVACFFSKGEEMNFGLIDRAAAKDELDWSTLRFGGTCVLAVSLMLWRSGVHFLFQRLKVMDLEVLGKTTPGGKPENDLAVFWVGREDLVE
jgi:hypothetical protein